MVVFENLQDGQKTIIVTHEGKRTIFPEKEIQGQPSTVDASSQLAYEALVDRERFPALDWLKRATSLSKVLGALSTAPSWARDDINAASPRDSMVIGPRASLSRQGLGLGLATTLYNIFTEHGEEWKLLEKSFCGEFPFVKRLVFPPDVGGSRISFTFEDEPFEGHPKERESIRLS
jgi:hypothetical protein